MKFLDAIQRKRKGFLRKWEHYAPIYDSYFEEIQHQSLNLLEIGIKNGGSLFTWQRYFPNSKINGIDINPDCKQFEEDAIKVFIGDQANVEFLRIVNNYSGPYDIVIDDGGHTMTQQITSFNTLFPLLNMGGFYVIEDWHTSYMSQYMDGEERTVDMLKRLIDGLNFWAFEGKSHDYYAENISFIHFYNGIVVIKKGENKKGKTLQG